VKSIIRFFGRLGLGAFFFALMFLIVDALVVPRIFGIVRPDAYDKSDYWGKSFVKESSMVADLRSIEQTSIGDVLTSSNFDGRYINVVRGLRLTEPMVVNPTRRIVAFGGSTTFCVEVPDALTWPSQLAQRVFDSKIEVINAGLSGATFADRVRAFEGLELTDSNDVAIFFVGVNDAVIGSQTNEIVGPLARWPRLRRVIEMTLSWSNSGRIALDSSQQLSFEITASSREAVDRFRQSLLRAEKVASASNVRLLVILQPNRIISRPSTWGAQVESLEEPYIRSFRDFYRQLIDSSEFQGRVVDGTRVFDALDESPYLDFAHVQEKGNQAIASFVFAELKSRGWLG
jgi:lysophospholipase L1-like esterase